LEAKKNELLIDSLFVVSEEEETSTDQLQIKKKCSKRLSFSNYHDGGEFEIVKKPELVWTNYLHSRFCLLLSKWDLDISNHFQYITASFKSTSDYSLIQLKSS